MVGDGASTEVGGGARPLGRWSWVVLGNKMNREIGRLKKVIWPFILRWTAENKSTDKKIQSTDP